MVFTEKLLRVPSPIEVGGRRVTRYHVTADPAGIDPEIGRAAYAILPELLPESDGTPPATFVVLHRGGDDGAYLAPDLDAYLADSLPEGTTGDRS